MKHPTYSCTYVHKYICTYIQMNHIRHQIDAMVVVKAEAELRRPLSPKVWPGISNNKQSRLASGLGPFGTEMDGDVNFLTVQLTPVPSTVPMAAAALQGLSWTALTPWRGGQVRPRLGSRPVRKGRAGAIDVQRAPH